MCCINKNRIDINYISIRSENWNNFRSFNPKWLSISNVIKNLVWIRALRNSKWLIPSIKFRCNNFKNFDSFKVLRLRDSKVSSQHKCNNFKCFKTDLIVSKFPDLLVLLPPPGPTWLSTSSSRKGTNFRKNQTRRNCPSQVILYKQTLT